MSKDGRYYKRFNFESLQMQEFEVRQLYNRTKKAILDFEEINFTGSFFHEKEIDFFSGNDEIIALSELFPDTKTIPNKIKVIGYDLSIIIKNIGQVPEDKYQLQIVCPMHTLKGKPIDNENDRNIIKSQPYKIITKRSSKIDFITVPSTSLIFPSSRLSS